MATAMTFCRGCGKEIHSTAVACPQCGAPQSSPTESKSRLAAVLLAFFLGWVGAHKFYLGRIGFGFLYLVFFWTGIPAILGIIEAIIYLTMTDHAFAAKYG
jgi:TM2 domain-containing membrane protein YozV